MKVALYPHHHCLPFWHKPSNPTRMFDPHDFTDWTFVDRDRVTHPVSELNVLPVLNGLLALDLTGAMAHVSLNCDAHDKVIRPTKRIWVQITTQAAELDADGLPMVVKDGTVQVDQLWGHIDGTYHPYELPNRAWGPEFDTPEFWTKFFLAKLREAKTNAQRHLNEIKATQREAEKVVRNFALVP